MVLNQSTIFKRHETRNPNTVRSVSERTFDLPPQDTNVAETLSKLQKRSTISDRHQQRRTVLATSSPSGSDGMKAFRSYSTSSIWDTLSGMVSQSSIHNRNERRQMQRNAV